MALKRYLLFAGNNYYADGGWDDFVDSFDTLEEAKSQPPQTYEWAHIVDGGADEPGVVSYTDSRFYASEPKRHPDVWGDGPWNWKDKK